MDLSIIIVSWNVKERLRENLRTLFEYGQNIEKEVFVVDNNSADNSVEMIRQEFPQVKLIANPENLGFAKANNQAIKGAQGDFILLLNPDMKILPGTLENMISWMKENKQAWVASCYLENEKGELIKHVRHFPKFSDQLAIVLKLPIFFPGILDNYIIKDFNYNKPGKADSVRGGFFMIRKEALKEVGLLDERFFIWFEEVDYCKRVYKHGGEVWYTPVSKCIDYIGQSFKQVPRGRTQRYFRNSMLEYFRKWKPIWEYYLLHIAWWIGLSLAFLGNAFGIKSNSKT